MDKYYLFCCNKVIVTFPSNHSAMNIKSENRFVRQREPFTKQCIVDSDTLAERTSPEKLKWNIWYTISIIVGILTVITLIVVSVASYGDTCDNRQVYLMVIAHSIFYSMKRKKNLTQRVPYFYII